MLLSYINFENAFQKRISFLRSPQIKLFFFVFEMKANKTQMQQMILYEKKWFKKKKRALNNN